MNQIRISDDALEDLNTGFLFYEAQQVGLGDYFVASIRSDIERLRFAGGAHQQVYRDYHRLIGRTFPFGVYYSHDEGIVTVWAVLDLRREPNLIRDRLSES